MELETISLKDFIAYMDTGQTFSIGFRTYNKRLGTGGEYIYFKEACKFNHLTAAERISEIHKKTPLLKNPDHYNNSTRNIKVLANGNIVKIHLRLVRKFNERIVL